ncbi:unnamed protein product [Schistocephalus solidus]|uniref:FYVE-type domain-containing protein n=1 Tax=Schistocephalus solidus TaxID=70667 RepID=A0A183T5I5_SCHSO|nr:unnamed protein product [Schistocephalus solidus]
MVLSGSRVEASVMCIWGICGEVGTTFRCKFCGTQFCMECGRGEFLGTMTEFDMCFVCNSRNFKENIPNPHARRYTPEKLAQMQKNNPKKGKGKKGTKK